MAKTESGGSRPPGEKDETRQAKDVGTTSIPEINTDRPDITESSIVVPKGSLQGENGVTWTKDRGKRTIDMPETLLRLGIRRRMELRMGVPTYFRTRGGPEMASGFGDVSLGVKQQIGPIPGGFELSMISAVSLPSGANKISSHGIDPFIKLPWSRELKKPWSIGGMFSLFWLTENGKRNLTWEPAFYVEREITRQIGVFIEYAADYHQRGHTGHILHMGTAYKIKPTQQIDCHMGFGLSPAAPGFFFAVGYSFRIDKLF